MLTDPRARILALALFGTLILCLESALPLGILALGTGSALLAHPATIGWRARILGLCALFAWTTAFSQGLFYAEWPRTPLVALGPVVFSREGVVHGLSQSLRLIGLFCAGILLAVSTPPDRLAAGLLAFRLPFGIVLMSTTVVRFLPIVTREWLVIRAARARRGRPAWRRSPAAWIALEVSLLAPLTARSMRRALTLAESLDTRGFHPTAPRAVRDPLRIGTVDVALIAALTTVTGAAVVARLLYAAYGAEVYYSPALRSLYGFVRAWM